MPVEKKNLKGWTELAPSDLKNRECINALVCEHNFIFYDDIHGLLALLARGSVKPVLFAL